MPSCQSSVAGVVDSKRIDRSTSVLGELADHSVDTKTIINSQKLTDRIASQVQILEHIQISC